MAKRWQYLVSALLMAVASGSLSITFHFRDGPAESLQSMNSTDLMKGMPSMDLLVGYLDESNSNSLCKGGGAALSWIANLSDSLLLRVHPQLRGRLVFHDRQQMCSI